MTEKIKQIKNWFVTFKNSGKETKYKLIKRVNSVVFSLMRYVVLIAIGYIILYPLFYMVSCSFRGKASFYDPSSVWLSSDLTLENFKNAIKVLDYGDSIINTLVFQIVSALLQIGSCAFIAYGLSRFKFTENKILLGFMFLLIIVPNQLMMLPILTTYSNMDLVGIIGLLNKLPGFNIQNLNILDSVWTFYLPALLGVGIRAGMIIYIYIQFFKGLPKELEEAAWIDGAGPLKTFLKIALPSSGVVIMTVTVFSVIWNWNDYYLSQLYLYQDSWPLAVYLSEIRSPRAANLLGTGFSANASNPQYMAITMAGCLLFILPVLVLYMFLQRKFVKSIDRVGITG